MIDRSKLLPYGIAFVATGVAVWAVSKEPDVKVLTKIETVQVVKEVEKVVTKEKVKWKTRIVYRSDGSTEVEEEGESETDSSSDKTKDTENRSKEDTEVISNYSKTYPYSIGVSCNNIFMCGDFRQYSVIGSVRLGTLPLSITVGSDINLPPRVSLGVRFDF